MAAKTKGDDYPQRGAAMAKYSAEQKEEQRKPGQKSGNLMRVAGASITSKSYKLSSQSKTVGERENQAGLRYKTSNVNDFSAVCKNNVLIPTRHNDSTLSGSITNKLKNTNTYNAGPSNINQRRNKNNQLLPSVRSNTLLQPRKSCSRDWSSTSDASSPVRSYIRPDPKSYRDTRVHRRSYSRDLSSRSSDSPVTRNKRSDPKSYHDTRRLQRRRSSSPELSSSSSDGPVTRNRAASTMTGGISNRNKVVRSGSSRPVPTTSMSSSTIFESPPADKTINKRNTLYVPQAMDFLESPAGRKRKKRMAMDKLFIYEDVLLDESSSSSSRESSPSKPRVHKQAKKTKVVNKKMVSTQKGKQVPKTSALTSTKESSKTALGVLTGIENVPPSKKRKNDHNKVASTPLNKQSAKYTSTPDMENVKCNGKTTRQKGNAAKFTLTLSPVRSNPSCAGDTVTDSECEFTVRPPRRSYERRISRSLFENELQERNEEEDDNVVPLNDGNQEKRDVEVLRKENDEDQGPIPLPTSGVDYLIAKLNAEFNAFDDYELCIE